MIGDYATNNSMLTQFTYVRWESRWKHLLLLCNATSVSYILFSMRQPFSSLALSIHICTTVFFRLFTFPLWDHKRTLVERDVSWIRQLHSSLSIWRPGFDPRPVHMGFMVEKVALKDFFLSTLFFPCIIAALLHILISFIYHWCCMSSNTESVITFSVYVFLSHELKPPIFPWI